MHRVSVNKTTGDRVYHAVKARVIACTFQQGRRIYLQPLADHLGVSTTPVREALNRLAAEDLVIKAPHKGFIAMRLSADSLLGHYELTRLLLTHELERLDAEARRALPEFEQISTVLYKLNRRILSDVNTLAAYTGEVFVHIASLGENAHVLLSVQRANDHLYYVRTVESRLLDNVQSELILLCELLRAGLCEDLVQVIHDYHDKRIEMLPAIMDFAGG